MTFTKQEIEAFYLETPQGFYLNECAKRSEDAKDFYKNQLKEFTAGFECCFKLTSQQSLSG